MCETFNCLSRPHNMQVATQGYLSNQIKVTKSSPESTREVDTCQDQIYHPAH